MLFGGDTPFFQTGDVKSAVLHLAGADQWYSEAGVAQSRVWDVGTACITIAANIAETAVLAEPACFPDSILGFVPLGQPEDAYFVKYLIDVYRTGLTAAARGTTQDNLSLDKLLAFSFPVPDATARLRISTVLRSFDELIENNRRRIEILEETVRSHYRDWCLSDEVLTERRRPSSHRGSASKVSLAELCTSASESVNPRSVDPSTPAVGLEHLPRRSTTLVEWERAEELGSRKLRFAAGDILFGKIRPYFHKVAVAPVAGICSTDAIVIRPRRAEFAGLVIAVTSSDDFVGHAVQTSNGTKMPRADWKVLAHYPVSRPADEVVEVFSERVLVLTGMATALGLQNRTLCAARDALLPKLVNGRIDVDSLGIDDVYGWSELATSEMSERSAVSATVGA